MARRPRTQRVVLTLDADDMDLLEREAQRQGRDPWGQAWWMLTRLLRSGRTGDEELEPEPAASGTR